MSPVPCGRVLGFGESCCDGNLCSSCAELQTLRTDHAESLQLIKESAQRLGMHVRAPRGPSTESESAKLLAYTNAVGEIVDDRDALRHRVDVALEALKILGIECMTPNVGIISLGEQLAECRRVQHSLRTQLADAQAEIEQINNSITEIINNP